VLQAPLHACYGAGGYLTSLMITDIRQRTVDAFVRGNYQLVRAKTVVRPQVIQLLHTDDGGPATSLAHCTIRSHMKLLHA
jgi:hypothetical protein